MPRTNVHIRYATGSIREIDEERSEGRVISGGAVNVHLHISRPTTIRLINKTGWEGNLADTSSWTRALNGISKRDLLPPFSTPFNRIFAREEGGGGGRGGLSKSCAENGTREQIIRIYNWGV